MATAESITAPSSPMIIMDMHTIRTVSYTHLIRQDLRKLSDHVRHIVMQKDDPGILAPQSHIAVRIIHGVLDIAMLQVGPDLLCRHSGAVIFGLFRGSAQMRDYNGSLYPCDDRRRKVCHIMLYLSGYQRVNHSLFVHQQEMCIRDRY